MTPDPFSDPFPIVAGATRDGFDWAKDYPINSLPLDYDTPEKIDAAIKDLGKFARLITEI
jgi:hypothetical protein